MTETPRYHAGDIVLYRGKTGRILIARKNTKKDKQREQMNRYKKPGQYVSNLNTGPSDQGGDLYLLEETDITEGRIIV